MAVLLVSVSSQLLRREKRRQEDRSYSLRQVAMRIGVEPAYLSKIERDQVAPPSEATTRRLAAELGEDPDHAILRIARDVRDDYAGKVPKSWLEHGLSRSA